MRNSIRIEGTQGFVEVHLYKNEILDGSPNALEFQYEGTSAAALKPQFVPDLFDAELRDFRDSPRGVKASVFRVRKAPSQSNSLSAVTVRANRFYLRGFMFRMIR